MAALGVHWEAEGAASAPGLDGSKWENAQPAASWRTPTGSAGVLPGVGRRSPMGPSGCDTAPEEWTYQSL
eukprot:15464554-Alexandrium_andersonii.AAC.1